MKKNTFRASGAMMDPPLLHPLPKRRRARRPTTKPVSGDDDARCSGPSAAAAASPHGGGAPRRATELNRHVGRWSGTADTQGSAPKPCSATRRAHKHPRSEGFHRHVRAVREAERHSQQSRRDLPQDARVTTTEHAREGTSPKSLCDDHCPEVTYTFQSTPRRKEGPNGSRRSRTSICDVSRLNAGSSSNRTAAVTSTVDELRSARPVSTVLRNLAAALFRGRWNALDRTPKTARAFDDTRTLNTEQEQARTYSCTMLLGGENEEITIKNAMAPCLNDQREPVEKVYALEPKNKVEATQGSLPLIKSSPDVAEGGTYDKDTERLPHGRRRSGMAAADDVSDFQCQCTKLFPLASSGDGCCAMTIPCSPLASTTEPSRCELSNTWPESEDQGRALSRHLSVVTPHVRQHAMPRDRPDCSGYTEEWEPRCSAEAFALAEHLKPGTGDEPPTPEFPALTLTSAISAVSFDFQDPWCHSENFGEPLETAAPNVAAVGDELTPDTCFEMAVAGLQKPWNLISLVTSSAQTGSSMRYLPTREVGNTKCADTQTSQARVTCNRSAQTQNTDMRWTEVCAPPVDQYTNRNPSLATSKSLSDVICSAPSRSNVAQMQADFLPLDLFPQRTVGHISAKFAKDIDRKESSKNILQQVAVTGSSSVRESHILTKGVSLSSRRCTLISSFKKNCPDYENKVALGSGIKTSSCPTFKKRTLDRTRVVPCGSKDVLFPCGRLDVRETTGMCLLPSSVIGRLFRKKEVFSTPIIPATTVPVGGTANKGQKAEIAEEPTTTTTSNKDTLQEPEMHLPSSVVTKDLQETTEVPSVAGAMEDVMEIDASGTRQKQPFREPSESLISTSFTRGNESMQKSSQSTESEPPAGILKVQSVPFVFQAVSHTKGPCRMDPRKNSADTVTTLIPAEHVASQGEQPKVTEDIPAAISIIDILREEEIHQPNSVVTTELQETKGVSRRTSELRGSGTTPTHRFSLSSRAVVAPSLGPENKSASKSSRSTEGAPPKDNLKVQSVPFLFRAVHPDIATKAPCKTVSRNKPDDTAPTITSAGDVASTSEKPKYIPTAISVKDMLREEEVLQRGSTVVLEDSEETKAPHQFPATGVRSTARPLRFGMSSQRLIATSLSQKSKLTKGSSRSTEGEPPEKNLEMQPVPIVDVMLPANSSRGDSNQTDKELTVKGGHSELPKVGEAHGTSSDAAKNEISSGKLRSDRSFMAPASPRKFVSCSCDWVDEASAYNPPVRSFSANVVRKRPIVEQEAMTARLPALGMADADPLITGVVHHCKNPKHKPRKIFRPGSYCLTCKNPRHRHGLPGATMLFLQPEVEKYILPCSDADVHRRKKQKDRNRSEKPVEPEEKEIARKETRVPVISVKTKQAKPVAQYEPPVCCYVSMTVCATIVALALVYLYFVHLQAPLEPSTTPLPPANAYYCSTEFCNREAARLKSLLSSTTGPCDNFYQHVCDKWVHSQRLESPETGTAISSDTMIQDQLIDSLAANLISSKQAGVAVELYNSCTDRTQSGRAFAAMNDLFRLWTIGRWPTDALASMRDVWSFAGELLRDVGLNALVDVHVAVHSEDPTKVAIGLKRPSFLFSCNDATRPAVINMLQDALVETMVAVARSANQQLIDEVMQVITRLSSSPLEPPVSETGMRGFSVVRLSDMDPGIVDLLKATFGNDSSLGKETKVVLKSADFLQGHLVEALRELPPRALMNYLGFLVFINLAPFFLDRHRLLRQLFSKSVLGRTLPDVSNTGRLCLVAVERVLPGCFAKISSQYFRASGGIVANKLSQLVTSFGRNVEHLAWMDDMAAVLSRYLLKEFATTPSSNDTAFCPTSFTSYAGDSSVKFFVAVSRDRQRRLLRPLTKSDGGDMATMSRSQLLTTATYDAPRRRLHVPAALFNVSVPANTSHFSLHFARFAVRFYGAVVEALLHRDAVQPSLRYSDDLQRRFEDLLGCFEWELRQLPAGLSHSADAPYSVTARGAFLQQTVAVQLAFRAFQELLQIRRTWNMDFRFSQLPDLSVDQLFFVYYALDNCEAADRVYQEHRGHWLPAHYRVNVPLRNVVEFAELFKCPPDSDMVRVSFVPRCTVVAVDRWDHSRPDSSF